MTTTHSHRITVQIQYQEHYLPTPRHRIHRCRTITDRCTVSIPRVSAGAAPVAIRHTSPFPSLAVHNDYGTKRLLEYRWYKRRLYVRCKLSRFHSIHQPHRNRWAVPRDIHWPQAHSILDSPKAAISAARRFYSPFILIDDALYEAIGEPRFVLMTFGLGHNHGLGWGTSLSVDHDFNPNIRRARYWRVDEERLANEAGRAIATERGDSKALPHFDKRLYDRFEILISDALRLPRRTQPVRTAP